MSIQVDDGEFTRLHNTILERLALARLTASEYRCLFFLFRQTYGWQKKEDTISLSQWAQGTGTDPEKRHNALRTLQGLVAKGVIYCKPNGNNHAATWGFNKHFEQWDSSLFQATVITEDNSLGTTVITPDNKTVIAEDNSTVITEDNKTVITGDNYKRKKEILKKGKKGESARATLISPREPANKAVRVTSPHLDPRHFVSGFVPQGTGANPVEVYYERFSINKDDARLNAIAEDDLTRLCPDLDKLRAVVVAYSRTPFRHGNMQLIFDWYRDGIPERHRDAPTNGYGKTSSLSESEKSKIVTRARNAQGALKTAQQFKGNIDPAWQEAIDTAKGFGLL